MNKYDFIVITTALLISLLLFITLKQSDSENAYVYYENNLIKTIDLNNDNEYEVEGYNGPVKIDVKNKKLKVKSESSPLHLCSKQGYTNKGVIVCLPNKITISFNDDLDARIG